jgi:hypothetical protein
MSVFSGILFAGYLRQHFAWRNLEAAAIPYALGWLAACAAWRLRSQLLAVAPRRTLWLTVVGTVALLAMIGAEGQWQFGGSDYSALVDVAWRQHIGQQVYKDFPCTFPPGFYLGARYAFDLFGVNWTAFVTMGCMATLVWIAWATWLLVRLLGPRPIAPLIAIAVAAMTQVVCGVWWYNPLATLAAAIFVLSALRLHRSPDSWLSLLSYCASMGILLLMKANMGAIVVAGVSIALALVGWKWTGRIAVLSTVGALASWGMLRANGISAADVLSSYRAVAGHGLQLFWGFRDFPLWDVAANIAMLCAIAFPVAAAMSPVEKQRVWQAARSVEGRILVVAAIGGLYCGMNNGEWKFVAAAIILMASVLFVLSLAPAGSSAKLPGANPSTAVAAAVALCAMFTAIGCGTGWYRLRVLTVGDFFEWHTLPPRQAPPFFKGLVAGHRFNETLDQIESLLHERSYQNVFFGPRLAFAYAAFGRPSPNRQPIWFQKGTFFPADREPEILRIWEESNFDLLIYAKNDFTHYSPVFLELIRRHYTRDDSLTRLTLFHRNGPPAAARAGRSADQARLNP